MNKEKIEYLSEIDYRISNIDSLLLNGKIVLAYFKVQGLKNYIAAEIKKAQIDDNKEKIINNEKLV